MNGLTVERVIEDGHHVVRVSLFDTAVELTPVEARAVRDDLDDAAHELPPCADCGRPAERGEWCPRCTDARDGML